MQYGRQAVLFPRANAVVEPKNVRETLGILQHFSVRLGIQARSSNSVRYELVGDLEELFVYLLVVLRILVPEKTITSASAF